MSEQGQLTSRHSTYPLKLMGIAAQLSANSWFWLLAALGICARLFFVWTGLAEKGFVADDSYYYFRIAENIARGFGSTFDRLAPTNGYHPLWMAILAPVLKFANTDLHTPVRIALTLSAGFDLVSGIVIYRLLKSVRLSEEAVLAAALWFLLPLTLFIGLRGTEASLSTMLTLLFLFVAFASRNASEGCGKSTIFAGILIGLSGLARTDNLVILGATYAIFVLARSRFRRGELVRRLGKLALAGLSALLVTAPWFVWNIGKFGSPLQVSGQVKFATDRIYGALPIDWSSFSSVVGTLFGPLIAPIFWPLRFLTGEEWRLHTDVTYTSLFLFAVVILVPFVLTGRSVLGRLRSANALELLSLPLIFMVVHTVVLGYVFRSYDTWYSLPYLACLCVLVGISLPTFVRASGVSAIVRLSCPTVLLLLCLTVLILAVSRIPSNDETIEKRAAVVDQITARYPGRVTVGAFNAGRLAWAASVRDSVIVTNLDCLVNNAAFAAVKEGKYYNYIVSTVDVMAEDPAGAAIFLPPAEVDSLATIYHKLDGLPIWARVR